jgi:hypothetical protein
MKAIKIFSMAVFALVMGACSEDKELEQPQGAKMHFVATIGPASGSATTRTTLTEITSGADEGTIKVAWRAKEDGVYDGDQIALFHGGVKDVVTVTAVDAETGAATIEGNITVPASDEEDVVLVYPAASVDKTGSGTGFTPNAIYAMRGFAQDGTLEYIQNYLDGRQSTGEYKIVKKGDVATLNDDVTMESKICIWKLSLTYGTGTNALNATKVTLGVGTTAIAQATSKTSKSDFYLCVVPATLSTASGDFKITAIDADGDRYTYTKSGSLSLATSKYYQSEVNLAREGNTVTLTSSTTDVTLKDGDILTGEGGENTKVYVAAGAKVTLSGVKNNNIPKNISSYNWAGLHCLGDAIITLADGTTNIVQGGCDCPGIFVPENKTVTINGNGTLEATGSFAAGIGAGGDPSGLSPAEKNCGNIVIDGGYITAKSNYQRGAGIGAAASTSCGDITITENVKRLTATWVKTDGGEGRCIGGSDKSDSKCGTVTILGSVIPSKSEYMKRVSSFTIEPKTVDLSTKTSGYTAQSGDILTGTAPATNAAAIKVADGAFVVLKDATIKYDKSDNVTEHSVLTCLGDAYIALSGNNILSNNTSNWFYYGGIEAAGSGKTLCVGGADDATLYMHFNNDNLYGAIIGSAYKSSTASSTDRTCGDIIIEGGNLDLYTNSYPIAPAVIGAGYSGRCGNILILGGKVKAAQLWATSCIGAGDGSSSDSRCGNITIGSDCKEVTMIKRGHSNDYGDGIFIGAIKGSTYCGTITIDGKTDFTIPTTSGINTSTVFTNYNSATTGNPNDSFYQFTWTLTHK